MGGEVGSVAPGGHDRSVLVAVERVSFQCNCSPSRRCSSSASPSRHFLNGGFETARRGVRRRPIGYGTCTVRYGSVQYGSAITLELVQRKTSGIHTVTCGGRVEWAIDLAQGDKRRVSCIAATARPILGNSSSTGSVLPRVAICQESSRVESSRVDQTYTYTRAGTCVRVSIDTIRRISRYYQHYTYGGNSRVQVFFAVTTASNDAITQSRCVSPRVCVHRYVCVW